MAMVTIRGPSSALPLVGMMVGMLLLGFAGVILIVPVVMPSTAMGPELTLPGAGEFLSRRLQSFGYISTTRVPSSFDSSDSSSSGSSFEPSKSFMSGSSESSEVYNILPRIFKSYGSAMAAISGSLLVQLLFAILYFRVVTEDIQTNLGKLDERMVNVPDTGRGDDFHVGICDCYKDKWVCLQTLCCPMVRIAHTNAVSGVCPFWESLWCWCCCAWLTVDLGPRCLLIWWRMRLKQIMKVEDNALNDFCITMFCPLISLCQMSSAMDSAMGYQVTGCCEYTPYSYGGPMDALTS